MKVKNKTIQELFDGLANEIARLEAEIERKEAIIQTQAETILKLANE
ncbi:hypothetical protein [Gottfriedia acidiceleris]|nr:hypothetical protein [Gottfriedia acidiceleris]